jgi:ketosteroid isomerase-like protein
MDASASDETAADRRASREGMYTRAASALQLDDARASALRRARLSLRPGVSDRVASRCCYDRRSSRPAARAASVNALAMQCKAAVTGGQDTSLVPEESTTPDPRELTLLITEAFNRRDFDEVMRFFASDAVFDMSAVGMGTLEGVAAIRGFYEDWVGSYEEYRAEIDEFVDFGNGITLAVLSLKGRPLGSSGEVRLRYASVGTTVENLVVQATNYLDVDEGRAAAERLAQERG